ncbi:terminus macrodomain insulation protein YfbV [Celerinatantimonas sp. YJH-8]|uniref:terminus macrodomain insulation protein YfbV n=1 Tax=Celerinatantimonas sp. YJH-8 TaxID=3228714 RepID=UPI0038C1DB02
MSSFSTVIRDGVHYSKSWPKEPALAAIFPEIRVILALNLLNKVMPALAVVTILLPYLMKVSSMLPQSAVFAVLFISLPFQVLYWLGHRANTELPMALVRWYRELHQQLIDAGVAVKPLSAKPRYAELADVLRKAFSCFDKSFILYGD